MCMFLKKNPSKQASSQRCDPLLFWCFEKFCPWPVELKSPLAPMSGSSMRKMVVMKGWLFSVGWLKVVLKGAKSVDFFGGFFGFVGPVGLLVGVAWFWLWWWLAIQLWYSCDKSVLFHASSIHACRMYETQQTGLENHSDNQAAKANPSISELWWPKTLEQHIIQPKDIKS